MKIQEPEISIAWLCNALMQLGLPESELVAYLGNRVYEEGGPLPVDDYLNMLAWGASTLKEPHLGLKIAAKINHNDYGLLSYISQNSATLGDLCHALIRYQAILMAAMKFSFHNHGDTSELRYQVPRLPNEGVRQELELTIGTMAVAMYRGVGDSHLFKRVNFSHALSGSIQEYTKIFNAQIYFDQPYNSIVLDSAKLALPITDSDPQLLVLLQQQADQLLLEMDDKADLLTSVRFYITKHLESSAYNINTLSQELNVTTRTLHRHLKKYNLTYQSLREEIMLTVAKEALMKTDASVTEIALKLGYSESSSFTRAFKRLCGISPLKYRSQSSP